MIGQVVSHPQYGEGQITALYRNGSEWMVRFGSGLRFRRPRLEFEGEVENSTHSSSVNQNRAMKHSMTMLNTPINTDKLNKFNPMTESQFAARQVVEALRVGVAPAQHVEELTIGLAEERTQLQQGLTDAHSQGGAAHVIVGDYGHGKSHIVELTAQEALDRNFLVAVTSLDLQEMPPHRCFDIYAGLMRNLRYPDTDERGLAPLLSSAANRESIREQMRESTTVASDPLAVGLEALSTISSVRQQKVWHEWLMGGRRVQSMYRSTPKGIKFPSIYKVGHNARQIAYMLSGVSALAKSMGYSGLAVLIDEAESYSLLKAYQRPKASLFFGAMVYAALQDRQKKISEATFPQHRFREYPMTYEARQSLYFLFTVTRSDNQMPLDEWLMPEQILELEPHHSAQEMGRFLEQAMDYHAQAYGYEIGERQRQIRRGAAEHMSLGMKNRTLSIRGAVRLSIELFDLLYLYPEYETAALLDELRATVR